MPVFLSHASTGHYTPAYILDAVIACMDAINPGPASNSTEIQKRARREALHHPGQRARAAVGREGLSQPPVRARRRGLVLEAVSGAGGRPDDRGHNIVEIGHRDRSLEDADGVVAQGVYSPGKDTVCGYGSLKRKPKPANRIRAHFILLKKRNTVRDCSL
jgi:hypothetical protein